MFNPISHLMPKIIRLQSFVCLALNVKNRCQLFMALNYQKKNIKNFIRANRTPFPHCLPKMCSFATNLTWLRKCRLGNGKKFPLSHFGPGSRQHCSKLSRIIILYGINVPFRCPTQMLRK